MLKSLTIWDMNIININFQYTLQAEHPLKIKPPPTFQLVSTPLICPSRAGWKASFPGSLRRGEERGWERGWSWECVQSCDCHMATSNQPCILQLTSCFASLLVATYSERTNPPNPTAISAIPIPACHGNTYLWTRRSTTTDVGMARIVPTLCVYMWLCVCVCVVN